MLCRQCMFHHTGCQNLLGPTWPWLSCATCLVPPPRARRIGTRIPGPPASRPILPQAALMMSPRTPRRFKVGVDGSGGWYRWGAGLTDWKEEVKEYSFGGLNRNLGALMAVRPEEKQFCDAMIAEALAMYFALNYVKKIYAGKALDGFIICDRTSLLANVTGKRLKNPVFGMAVALVRHEMTAALKQVRSVTFVHKRRLGYNDKWQPDRLARKGRKQGRTLNGHIHVPIPLRIEELLFVDPIWRRNGELLERVTVMLASASG